MKKRNVISYAFKDGHKLRKKSNKVFDHVWISLFLPFFLMGCQMNEERVYEKQDFTVRVNGIDIILFERIDAIFHEKDLPTEALKTKVKAGSTAQIILMNKNRVVSDKIFSKNDGDKEISLNATRVSAFTIEDEQIRGNTIGLPNNLEFQTSKKQDIEKVYGIPNDITTYKNVEILKYKVTDENDELIFVMVFQLHDNQLSGIGYANAKKNTNKPNWKMYIQQEK